MIFAVCVPTKSTPRMQEMHITIGHAICELLEERLARRETKSSNP